MTDASVQLTLNGLNVPPEFPSREFESVLSRVQTTVTIDPELYEQFAGAWNALAYRYVTLRDVGLSLSGALSVGAEVHSPSDRYLQERYLFEFFSNGFAVFEATFYGLFAIGAFLSPDEFPIREPAQRIRINPASTEAALKKAFDQEPIVACVNSIRSNVTYTEWREVRNILTHRAAPGRIFYADLTGELPLPDVWKLNNIVLNASMPQEKWNQLSSLVTMFLVGIEKFTESHF